MKDYARSEPRLKVVSSSQLLNNETKAKILKLFIKGSRPRLSKKLAQSLENLYLFCQAMAQKESLCSVWNKNRLISYFINNMTSCASFKIRPVACQDKLS